MTSRRETTVLASPTNPNFFHGRPGQEPPQRLIALGDWTPEFWSASHDRGFNSPAQEQDQDISTSADSASASNDEDRDKGDNEFENLDDELDGGESVVESEDQGEEEDEEEQSDDEGESDSTHLSDKSSQAPLASEQLREHHLDVADKDPHVKYITNITISRDQTKESAFEKELLSVLCQPGDRQLVRPEDNKPKVSKFALQDYQIQLMLLEQQNKKRLLMARQEQEDIGHTMDANLQSQAPTTLASADAIDLRVHGESSSAQTQQKIDQIAQLEEHIQHLRSLQKALGSSSWHVFHKIEGEDATYLVEPSWTFDNHHDLRLRGNSPLSDETGYLRQRPDVAFVVYKNYQYDHQSTAIQKARVEGTMLPEPVPANETIKLLSPQMVAAVDAFLHVQPTLEVDFPNWRSTNLIYSPFLFWYKFRSPGCLQAIPEPHRSQMRLLTGWIDQHYDHVYAEADNQFARGYVSQSTMPFFVLPGEVLVSRDSKSIQGYIADSWTRSIGRPQYNERSRGQERRKLSAYWSVSGWSYAFDGRFYRSTTILPIEFQFDQDHPEVDIAKLRVLPLRFANADVRAKLDRCGRMVWACRNKKLIAYEDKAKNDLLGVSWGDAYP